MTLLVSSAAVCLGCRTSLVRGRAVPHAWVHVDRTGEPPLTPEEHTRLVYDTQHEAWADLCLPCAVRFLTQRLIREVERRRSAEARHPGLAEAPTVPPLSPY